MLTVIDEEEKISNFMPILDKMMTNGLVVTSDVDVITYRYGSSSQSSPSRKDSDA